MQWQHKQILLLKKAFSHAQTQLFPQPNTKLFEFLQQMFTASHTPPNARTFRPFRKASQEALLLSDRLCLRDKVPPY